jgi:hypothetical protein
MPTDASGLRLWPEEEEEGVSSQQLVAWKLIKDCL